MTGIPTQDSCDWNKPSEALLWASMYIPVLGRSPMVFPRLIAERLSEHYDACGFVHVDRIAALADENGYIHVDQLPKQRQKLVRPYRGQQTQLNPMGRWAPMDEEEPEPIVIQDPAAMTVHEREAQVERLRYLGYKINEPEPAKPKGGVEDPLDLPPEFNPDEHSVTEVNAYLRACEDRTEYVRVVRAEKRGQARKGILKRFDE